MELTIVKGSNRVRQHLPKGYETWWLEVANHLGGVYPYQNCSAPFNCTLDLGAIIESRRSRGESLTLDPVGLVAKASLPFLLGNRTLLKNVKRAPWMAYPGADGSWHPGELPEHGDARPDPKQFTNQLRMALIDEVRGYTQSAKTVGILLSGGMDSRVLAGVVRAVQEEAGGTFSVVGLTWGRESSRDVIYARRITERFGWEWQHYAITAETLAKNIRHSALMGAEVSPLHLHALPDVAKTNGIDVVIAGSYGDSVGRAEFSGRRVTQLGSLLSGRMDRFGVLRTEAVASAEAELRADLVDTPFTDVQTPLLRTREIEQEMHYMRRMLQACMLTVARDKRFYQLFTAPNVFGRMWALDPAIRGDEWYRRLLSQLPGSLLDIPWARTGRRYDRPDEREDEFSRQYHSYGTWLRRDLRDDVLRRVNSDYIRGLGLFNDRGLNLALKAWGRASTSDTNSLDELFSWIASLHDFLEIYQVCLHTPIAKVRWRDNLSAVRGGLLASVYVEVRERFRD